jgi:hypothetical protein
VAHRLIRHDDKRLPADAGGFWPWAKRHLAGQRGLGPANFALRLKELEFRHNHREQDICPRWPRRSAASYPTADPRPCPGSSAMHPPEKPAGSMTRASRCCAQEPGLFPRVEKTAYRSWQDPQ